MLLAALQHYYGDNKYKMRAYFKTLISNDAATWRLQETSELRKTITWNKIHSLKQVVSVIYILGKDFFVAATFKGL